jgi:hypothetical protein
VKTHELWLGYERRCVSSATSERVNALLCNSANESCRQGLGPRLRVGLPPGQIPSLPSCSSQPVHTPGARAVRAQDFGAGPDNSCIQLEL